MRLSIATKIFIAFAGVIITFAAVTMTGIYRTQSSYDQLEALNRTRTMIEELLRNVRGPQREEVFEACGLSLAPPPSPTAAATNGAANGAATTNARPRRRLACRLAAGVPLPLALLRTALGPCFRDGMLTTRPETLGPEYQLPLSAAGNAIEAAGQRSILLFAAVPLSVA